MRTLFILIALMAASFAGLGGVLSNQFGALSYAASGLTPQQWDDLFFAEYVRGNRFKKAMGTDENSIFQIKEDLAKKQGDTLHFALVNQLKNAGVTGDSTLEGNEESLDSRSQAITVDYLRHAVIVNKRQEQFSAIDLRNAGKALLKSWAQKQLRDSLIQAMGSVDGVNYGSSSTAQKNTWCANNVDRVLFGASQSNYSATFLTATANIDNTADKVTAAMLSEAKRMAMAASPAITPVIVNEDEEWFVVYLNSRAFRDLRLDTTIIQANQYAMERGKNNPLFTGGDLLWDGMIIKEIPEVGSLLGYPLIGAGAIAVGANFLCGAQAVGIAWAQRTVSTTDTRDYGFKTGVGVEECRGIQKLRFGTSAAGDTTTPKDHGIVTVWAAAGA